MSRFTPPRWSASTPTALPLRAGPLVVFSVAVDLLLVSTPLERELLVLLLAKYPLALAACFALSAGRRLVDRSARAIAQELADADR